VSLFFGCLNVFFSIFYPKKRYKEGFFGHFKKQTQTNETPVSSEGETESRKAEGKSTSG
jgi:hypothetical protein